VIGGGEEEVEEETDDKAATRLLASQIAWLRPWPRSGGRKVSGVALKEEHSNSKSAAQVWRRIEEWKGNGNGAYEEAWDAPHHLPASRVHHEYPTPPVPNTQSYYL
jgi:hypothetical protein